MQGLSFLCAVFYVCGVFLCSSCSKQDYAPESKVSVSVSLSLEGAVPEMRGLSFNVSEDPYQFPSSIERGISPNYLKYPASLPITVILKNKENSQTVVLKGRATVSTPDGSPSDDARKGYNPKVGRKIHFEAVAQSDSPVNLASGSWYVAGFLGGSAEERRQGLRFNISDSLSQGTKVLDIPIAFPWTRVSSSDISGNYLHLKGLQFKPLGCLIGIQLSNATRQSLNVTKITLKGSLKKDGLFSYAGAPEEGEFLPFSPDDATDDVKYSLKNASSALSSCAIARNNSSCIFYTWVMPKDGGSLVKNFKLDFSYDFRSKSSDSGGASPEMTYEWAPTSKPGQKILSGKTYQIKAALKASEPIISEVFFYQHKWSSYYSLVEIYNPGLKPIDLRKYFIVRIRNGQYFPYSNTIDGCRMMPLYCKDGEQPFRLGSDTDSNTDWHEMLCHFYSGTSSNENLDPGKTAVYGASGYYKDMSNFESSGNGVGPDLVTYGVNAGNTQILVGLDSSARQDAWGSHRDGSVMQLDPGDGLLLLKYLGTGSDASADFTNSNGGKYEIIDHYQPSGDKKEKFWMTRKDYVTFPSKQVHLSEWVRTHTDGAEIAPASVGSRYRWWTEPSAIEIPNLGNGN